MINPNGSAQRRIFKPRFDDVSLYTAWSPSGARIAYVAGEGPWTMSPSGKSRQQLTKGKGETSGPTWSADEKRIAFTDLNKRGGRNYDIYVINADGSGLRRLVGGKGDDFSPAWSPNGKTIMFERAGALWTVRPDGTGQKKIGEGGAPAWAPDGTKVAFDLKGDIWTMKANGTGARLAIEIPSTSGKLAWSPDARWIVYAIGDRGDLWLNHPDGTGAKRLTHEPGLYHSLPAWQTK